MAAKPQQKSILAGAVGSTLSLLLEPLATGALFAVIAFNPANVRALSSLITPLSWLFGLGCILRFHRAMNSHAFNNWSYRSVGEPWKFGDEKRTELVLITGGCSGFGRLMAKDFAKHARVVILDIQEPPQDLKEVSSIHFYHCDITDPKALQSTAATIRKEHGNPSVLINNAGIALGKTILDATNEYTEKIFKVNVISHFYTIKEFLPSMLEARKGHIVSMCSIASFVSLPPILHYCATKTAANYLSDGLRTELLTRYPNGNTILTTSVHPTFHNTPMIASIRGGSSESQTARASNDPVFPAENVSTAVVEHVLNGRSGKLFMPENQYYISFMKFAPTWLVDLALFARWRKTQKAMQQAAGK